MYSCLWEPFASSIIKNSIALDFCMRNSIKIVFYLLFPLFYCLFLYCNINYLAFSLDTDSTPRRMIISPSRDQPSVPQDLFNVPIKVVIADTSSYQPWGCLPQSITWMNVGSKEKLRSRIIGFNRWFKVEQRIFNKWKFSFSPAATVSRQVGTE